MSPGIRRRVPGCTDLVLIVSFSLPVESAVAPQFVSLQLNNARLGKKASRETRFRIAYEGLYITLQLLLRSISDLMCRFQRITPTVKFKVAARFAEARIIWQSLRNLSKTETCDRWILCPVRSLSGKVTNSCAVYRAGLWW